jgi:hypothetical protein
MKWRSLNTAQTIAFGLKLFGALILIGLVIGALLK